MENQYKKSYKSSNKELVSLCIYNAGYQKCNPRHQWGPGVRDHYLIHHVISGSGFYTVGAETYRLSAGDTFLVYPHTEITYYADADHPWEYAWVGFNGSDAALILKATDFSSGCPVIHETALSDSIRSGLLGIYEARGNAFANSVEMTGRLYQTLALFMKHSEDCGALNTVSSYVQKGISFISANYSYPISVEDIADYVGVSRSHLYRSFEVILSQSPKSYLTQFRLKQACYLLEHSSLSITAVANSVGFDNSLHFSKTFHQHIGLSPRAYRQSFKL